MHQLIDKKNKIIIYLLLLFILSTTSGKFVENQNSYSFTINQIKEYQEIALKKQIAWTK